MSAEESKEVARRFVEKVMNGGISAPPTGSSPQTTSTTTAPGVPPGPQGVKRLIGKYRSAFPDIRFETKEMIREGDTVAHRWTLTGRAHGGRVEVAGVEMNRVENGRISASWTVSDALGLTQQLGLTPSPQENG